ncbi:TonB-dependent receptor plug domain-containing protein, partial [candidate division GN15 bacterium]|nr:TonB-dependent receptor plug domain-containing protein [candidate division GN15 bacterium]
MMVGISKRLLTGIVLLLLGAFVLPLNAFAASTGQIKGQITDEKTGEPVIGATVVIVGTTRGAATDIDGRFEILRVDPGTYTVKISHLDYNTVEVTDIQVRIDQTSEVFQELSQKVTDIGTTITVKGTPDILDKFVVSSQTSISQEAIKQRPVTTVDQLLEQVAGVQTTTEGEVFIRGGRAGEVSYIVDGVPINDPLGGTGRIGANLSLVSGSIAEIQIIKDGFDPEYGNALSGIVNIRSLTGSKDNTLVNLQYITDDLGSPALNKYSRNYDYFRASISGPDPILSDKILPSLGLNFLRDQEFTYYLYFDVDKDDGFYQMQDYDTPVTKRSWPSFSLFGIDVPERTWNRVTGQANFKFRPRNNLQFVFSYKRWYVKRTNFPWEYRYSNATAPIAKQDRTSMSLEVVQSVSKDMNYELILSMVETDNSYAPGDPNHPGKTLEPD